MNYRANWKNAFSTPGGAIFTILLLTITAGFTAIGIYAMMEQFSQNPPSPYFLLILGILVPYFLPAIIASARNHHQRLAIFVLNLFLGWTFLGWLLALIWACTAVKKDP